MRGISKVIMNFYFDLHVSGIQNIPEKGPVIFAFNHINFWDPILIGMLTKRVKYSMAKKELFSVKKPLKWLGAYPVNTKPEKLKYADLTKDYSPLFFKQEGERFLEKINKYLLQEDKIKNLSELYHKQLTIYALKTGDGVLVFPSATRDNTYARIKKSKKGAAWHALQMNDKYEEDVKIISGAIVYTLDKEPFIGKSGKLPFKTDVHIHFDEPMTIEHALLEHYRAEPKEAAAELTDIINEHIASSVCLIHSKLNTRNINA